MSEHTRIWSQRDSTDHDLEAHGCSLYSTVAARDIVTNGDMFPSSQKNADLVARKVLNLSGASMASFMRRGLTFDELTRAVKALDGGAAYPNISVQQRSGVSLKMQLIPQLRANNDSCALIAVKYGVLVDAGKGIGTFRDGHCMVIFRPGDSTVKVKDPLRRSTMTLSIDLIETAMERFGDDDAWGHGRGEAITMFRWDTYQTLMKDARKQRDAAERELKTAEAKLDLYEAQNVPQLLARATAAESKLETIHTLSA